MGCGCRCLQCQQHSSAGRWLPHDDQLTLPLCSLPRSRSTSFTRVPRSMGPQDDATRHKNPLVIFLFSVLVVALALTTRNPRRTMS